MRKTRGVSNYNDKKQRSKVEGGSGKVRIRVWYGVCMLCDSNENRVEEMYEKEKNS